jgi:hypothetical protein
MSEHHVTEYSVGQVIEQLKYGGFEVVRCYSKPYKSENLKFEVAKKLFSIFASVTGSHHQLESTVFYLAQRFVKKLEKSAPKTWATQIESRESETRLR